MSRRNRPSAFDVSFPGEASGSSTNFTNYRSPSWSVSTVPSVSSSTARSTTVASGSSRFGSVSISEKANGKKPNTTTSAHENSRMESAVNRRTRDLLKGKKRIRDYVEIDDSDDEESVAPSRTSIPKRPRSSLSSTPQPQALSSSAGNNQQRYIPNQRDLDERKNPVIIGEDSDPEDAKGDGEIGYKPVRILTDFVIFDPKHSNAHISLSLLEDNDGVDRAFEAVGNVLPMYANEEDEGQEDDGLDEDENQSQRLRTSAIFNHYFDYTSPDEPMSIQTQFAWYILKLPNDAYKQHYYNFYRPHRIAQIVVSSALANRDWTYRMFCDSLLHTYDELMHKTLTEDLIRNSIPTILSAIGSLEESGDLDCNLRELPLLKAILKLQAVGSATPQPRIPSLPQRQRRYILGSRAPRVPLSGNKDIAVLRPENQNRTHVTPLVDRLATGLFNEHLKVVGPPPKAPNKEELAQIEKKLYGRVVQFVHKASKIMLPQRTFSFPIDDKLADRYWKKVIIDGVEYKVGDTIVVEAGEYNGREGVSLPSKVPETAKMADYFWFGRIIFIDQKKKVFHVHWFEHSSKTIMQEISDQQELFYTETCHNVDIRTVLGKVVVLYEHSHGKLDSLAFYCKMLYNEIDATFQSIPSSYSTLAGLPPPENCPICIKQTQRDEDEHAREIPDGVAFHGINFHINDFVLIRASGGVDNTGTSSQVTPSHIGQITDVKWPSGSRRMESGVVSVHMLGRISDISSICPSSILKDEHHLFLTDAIEHFPVANLIRKCRVLHPQSIPTSEFQIYLNQSPLHFFVKYHFTTLRPKSWGDRTRLSIKEVLVCASCFKEEHGHFKELVRFSEECQRKPLRAFDPFSGVGAFGLGMEEAGVLKVTHAVEISPSASQTLKKNSPQTVVYNQCSNKVLKYAIKTFAGHKVKTPQAIGSPDLLPPPVKPSDVDCLIAGLPCQPHSRLNMFQKADDKKSHLILNLLSWVDFLKPKYCYFENVRGFLKYNLQAKQFNKYTTRGGIEMGGLKFVLRALIAMNYQVRFGLLQAAHYGTPQTRVRFFLIASQTHLPLPFFPQPTHHFPLKDALQLKFPGFDSIRPIETGDGLAPLNFISVDDAISDLPRFDWKPFTFSHSSRIVTNFSDDEVEVPAVPCDSSKFYCGLKSPEYFSRPRTSFQVRCRGTCPKPKQHFTRVLKDDVVKRVIKIPLQAKADYKSLDSSLWEWQFANPSSAMARDGFRHGLYGRLDQNAWFNTTVTNVEPTAKQSWVLNPYCKRVVTVRELARSQGFPDSFEFYSYNNSVKTMHRQIGNAVSWPVSIALGRELREALFQKWQDDKQKSRMAEEILD
ncbi:DNA (cytosine-5)-methyltransferase [Abortiporus biennis]